MDGETIPATPEKLKGISLAWEEFKSSITLNNIYNKIIQGDSNYFYYVVGCLVTMDAAISHLSAKEREAVMAEIDKVQYQDTMETYNGITQRCFNECIISFKSKDLVKHETECIGNCVKKFIAYSQRVSLRFGEKAS